MIAPPVFDVCGPLPTGTTVLEASAGTGKTFTIAALATRYVAEGVAELSELMLVTFGRAATAELRERVRERLVSTERELCSADARSSSDAVVAHLAAVDDAELDRRRARLTRALSEFDAATIATTHAFSQQMLSGLGVTGDVDADAVLVPDIADLVDEVVDDLYLQRYAATDGTGLAVRTARSVAHAAVGDHHAELQPAHAAPDSPAGHRFAFGDAARTQVARRKRRRRLVDYDDLLVLLRNALVDPVSGQEAAERVRSRYRVVMVDEFQDTDPVQWEVLQQAFGGHRTLVLIGDPTQASYAFRGADVVTYLDAAATAGATATLGRSWRSDAPLLHGLEHVFAGAALGDPRIVVRPVEAEHTEPRLAGAPALRLRMVTRAAVGTAPKAKPAVGPVRALIARDVAQDVVAQLTGEVRLDGAYGWRPVEPGDIAVLTRRNEDASSVRQALAAAGVPAVQSALSSVFATAVARDWLTLLRALEQPGRPGRVATAALTPFLSWDAERLALADERDRDRLAGRVRDWAHVLGVRGLAALLEVMTADGLAERLLGTVNGERDLTDVRHVGQALHEAATSGGLGPSALADWLRHRVEEAGQDYAEERSRRLESDAAAVQVITVHASKGLEFPIVYVPFGWDKFESRTPEVLRYHDDAGRRTLDIGGPGGAAYDAARSLHMDEERGEDLRLLYVALTRARSQVVAWWAPSNNSAAGPLSRLLFGGAAPGHVPPASVGVPPDADAWTQVSRLAANAGGSFAVEQVSTGAHAAWAPPTGARPSLAAATFRRRLDTAWRRTSYSGLTAAVHGEPAPEGVASEPEAAGVQDEADLESGGADGASRVPSSVPPADAPLAAVPSPMADLPGGATFGTVVHAVLEVLDTSAADLDAELLRCCGAATTARVPGLDPAVLAAALAPGLATPLGLLAGGLALRDIAPADRLAEMDFELPMAGGDLAGRRHATLSDVAALLRRHVPSAEPLGGYADLLDGPMLRGERLRGYLGGSLDAVVRLRGTDGEPRYLVVDYKTNRLAPPDEPLTAWHYRPDALAEAMLAAHYPLQLLLYSVALHRFLRWRQPGYDPERHLGGGLYLFLRGMCGPATPAVDGVPCGVFGWRPPTPLVTGLSRLLDGEAP